MKKEFCGCAYKHSSPNEDEMWKAIINITRAAESLGFDVSMDILGDDRWDGRPCESADELEEAIFHGGKTVHGEPVREFAERVEMVLKRDEVHLFTRISLYDGGKGWCFRGVVDPEEERLEWWGKILKRAGWECAETGQ